MGVFIAFLFICVTKTIAANEVNTAATNQVPELTTSSLKYTAQEYHLPSHALYTLTPRTISGPPALHIDPPSVTKYMKPDVTQEQVNPVIPAFQENVNAPRFLAPQVLNEIRINKPSRKCTVPEEKSVPSIVKTENIPKDLRTPKLGYSQISTPQYKSETTQIPRINSHQKNEINLQFPDKPRKETVKEVHDAEHRTDNSNSVKRISPKLYNQQHFSDNVMLSTPFMPRVAPRNIDVVRNHGLPSVSYNSEKKLENQFNKNAPADAVSYLHPTQSIVNVSRQKNYVFDNTKEIDDVRKLRTLYNNEKQRDTLDKSEFLSSSIPKLNTKVDYYYEKPKVVYPQEKTLINVDSSGQKQRPLQADKVPLNGVFTLHKEPYIIPETYFSATNNNLPKYKSITSNIIDCNAIDEAVVNAQMQKNKKNSLIKQQTNNLNAGKGYFDYSELKNENADIQKQIERIKQKYTTINTPAQMNLNKKQNLDTDKSKKLNYPNNILDKSEIKTESNYITNIDELASNKYVKDMSYDSVITGPLISKSNLDKVSKNERILQSPQIMHPTRERFITQEQIETIGHPVELKNYNNNLHGLLKYCDANALRKEIPISNQDLYYKNIAYAGDKPVNAISNNTNFDNCVPITYDVSGLDIDINEILQSEKIKQIIDDAVRKSLTCYKIDDNVVRPNNIGTIASMDSKYNPCFNHINLAMESNPIINNELVSSIDKQTVFENRIVHAPNGRVSNSAGFIRCQDSKEPIHHNSYPSYNISPLPVQPMIIAPPEANLLSITDKIMKDQPRVYKKVTSACPDSLTQTPFNNELNCKPNTVEYQPTYTPIDPSLFNPSYVTITGPCKGTIDSSKSLDSAPPHSDLNQIKNIPRAQCEISSNDKYSSLLSSSLNNISSIILTNLLSNISPDIANNIIISAAKPSCSPSEIISELTTAILLDECPSLEIPSFEVIPPCVESPRFLAEPSSLPNNSTSVEKPTSCKTSKSKSKLSKKQSVSTITINVLPSVQQTSNDIIILV